MNLQSIFASDSDPTFGWTLKLPGNLAVIHPATLYSVDPRWRFAPFRFAFWLSSYLVLPFFIAGGLKKQRYALVLFSSLLIVPVIVFNPLLISVFQGVLPERAITRLVLLPPYGLILAWFFFEQARGWFKRLLAVPALSQWTRVEAWAPLLRVMALSVVLLLGIYIIGRQGFDNLIDLYDPSSNHIYSSASTQREARLPTDPEYAFIIDNIARNGVVASDPVSGYYLGGITGRPVISVPRGHYPPFGEPPPWTRRQDSVDILQPSVDITETVQLLDSYNVCAVWIDSRIDGLIRSASNEILYPDEFRQKFVGHPELFKLMYQDTNVTIFSYLRAHRDCMWQEK